MKTVSLVLSGGGARGIAHIGVLEVLDQQGYKIHAITGTSMGAVVGGIYAAGKIEAFKKWILDLDKIDVFKLVDFTFFNSGLIKGDKVFNELSTFIEDNQIQNLPINFAATATNLVSRKEVLFTAGSLYDAMRASIAIPNVITPVKSDDAMLVDGGVVNNIPVNHAPRIDNDLLIAVNVNADIELPVKKENEDNEQQAYYESLLKKFNDSLKKLFSNDEKKKLGYFDIMNDSFEIMRNELVKLSLENNPPDILIETPREICNIYDFYKAEELIEVGRKAALKSLKNYKNQS